MADIIVDVSLPSPLTANVISPTQALATNISVPGPQGPTGPIGPSGVQGPSGSQGLTGPTGVVDTGILDLRYVSLIDSQNISGVKTFISRPTVNGTGFLLSGEAAGLPNTIVYITGDQTISGIKTFNVAPILDGNPLITGVDLSAYLTSSNASVTYATINNLVITGSILDSKINTFSGTYQNFVNNLDATYATDVQLYNTGSTLDSKINLLSGYINDQDNTISINLGITGSTLDNKINSLSGWSASATNLASTGSTLNTKIDNLSGYVNSQDTAISNNLSSTGSTLLNTINNLSGQVVFTTDNQTINGTKIFTENISGSFISGNYINAGLTSAWDSGPRNGYFLGNGHSIRAVDTSNGIGFYSATNSYPRFLMAGPTLRMGVNGALLWNTTNDVVTPTSTTDVGIYRDLANTLAQRNGINPQQFRVYNSTGTNSGEFGLFGWQNNQLFIGAQATNSGILRPLVVTGDSISYSGKILTIAHANAGLFMDATGPTIRGNHWGAGDAGFIKYRNGLDLGRGGSTYLRVDSASPTVIVGRGNTSYQVGVGFDGTNSALSSPDAFIMRDASGVLSLRNPITNLGNSPQQLRIFNITGTNTGEFGLFGWQNNRLILGSQATNSGISRDILLTGNNVLISGNNFKVDSNGRIYPNAGANGGIATNNNLLFYDDGNHWFSMVRYQGFTIDGRFGAALNWSNGGSAPFGSVNLSILPDASDILAQRRGTNPQQFRVYNSTGTNSGEFGLLGWQNNQLIVGSQATNSGISRDMLLTGNNVLVSGANIRVDNNGRITINDQIARLNGAFGIASNGADFEFNSFGSTRAFIRAGGIFESRLAGGGLNWNFGVGSVLFLGYDANHILAQKNGTNPQQFRVYNATGTNSGEFGLVGWINSGFVIGAQATNSGILRDTIITGNNISLRSANLDANGYINLSNPQRFRIRSATNGMFAGRDGVDSMNLTAQGHRILLRSDGSISWSNSTSNLDQYAGDTFIGRDAQGIIAQRDGVNPQQFRVYNATGTNSGEFGLVGWQNNNLIIGAQATNSGILRSVVITGRDINILGNLNVTGNINVSGNDILIAPASYVYITNNQTSIINGTKYLADTANGSFGFNLPASPTTGYYLEFADPFYTWSGNNFILSGNGSNIEGENAPFTGDIEGQSIKSIFVGGSYGWRIV